MLLGGALGAALATGAALAALGAVLGFVGNLPVHGARGTTLLYSAVGNSLLPHLLCLTSQI